VTKTLYKLALEQLKKIIRDYEAAPAQGNSIDEMLQRTEYLLAKQMLSKKERE
jgi:hypothetical protein